MSNTAIILAAGNGTRMKADKSKLLLEINNMTVIERTVKTFFDIDSINNIIVTVRENDLELFKDVLINYDVSFCFGGGTRQQSVANAVKKVESGTDLLIIHDGARPLITKGEILSVIEKAQETGAAAIGVSVKDTIKVIDSNNKIIDTPDRSSLIAVQTPQIFDYKKYLYALNKAEKELKDFTDDCKLLENAGDDVYIVNGSYSNIKITTPEDISVALSILKSRGEQ